MSDDDTKKSNLSASVAAMSQRLKAARQQQSLSTTAADGLILSGRSHSPTPDRSHSPPPTPISVKAAQADLELRIIELEVTSMTDRIRERESRLLGVTEENAKLQNIIEQLEMKLMTLMESKEDDLKERQLQWEEESNAIVQEFQIENQELRTQVDAMAEELDATKSALFMLQEDYRKMYGTQYLGGEEENIEGREDAATGYDWHSKERKYVILDDRPTAAKPDTPLHDRFVQTETKVGLTEDDADWAIEILLSGPHDTQTRPLKRKPSLGVRSLDEIFSHEPCNISADLAILLTPDRSPRSIASSPKQQEQQEQPKQEPQSATSNADESIQSSSTYYPQYESEILAAMCDYSNICPTLVALMQPPTMDESDDYRPLPTMMKSFEEEKKSSFDEIEEDHQQIKDNDDDDEEEECNLLLEPAESFDSLDDNKNKDHIPASRCSPPPMKMFHKFLPTFSENNNTTDDNSEDNNDIGLDDLGPRWKA
jgi:hypothetical protein